MNRERLEVTTVPPFGSFGHSLVRRSCYRHKYCICSNVRNPDANRM